MHNPAISLRVVSWPQAESALRQIRQQVFIQEQCVPLDLEWDGLDEQATHLLLEVEHQPVACARLLATQQLGRMAVLAKWRGIGLGSRVMQCAIEYAQQQAWDNIQISAQIHAVGFYQRFGFQITSEPYLDAGILHCDMVLPLSTI